MLLVQSLETLAGLEADLRLTSQMRSVAQISPAVAHDLRAPINAMVFNIEILKEMLASGRATDPANKDKLLRYVSVLKEELSRLHRGLENFLAYISPRGDQQETLDLRELAEELAALLVAPARKQQAQVKTELPEGPVPVDGNRLPAAAGAAPPLARGPGRGAQAGAAPPAARARSTAAPGCACTASRAPRRAPAGAPEPARRRAGARVRPQLLARGGARPALGGAGDPRRARRRGARHGPGRGCRRRGGAGI